MQALVENREQGFSKGLGKAWIIMIIMPRDGDDKLRAEVGYAWIRSECKLWLKIENKASQRVLEKLGFQNDIVLRNYTINKDANDYLILASDDRVTRYLRWNTITSKEEALTYIEKVAITHPWRRVICSDDRCIGYVSVKPESGDNKCRAHLSYAVGADYWGQGIVTTAVKMAITLVFNEFPGLVRLEALVEVENSASQRVLEKVGFLKEGIIGRKETKHYHVSTISLEQEVLPKNPFSLKPSFLKNPMRTYIFHIYQSFNPLQMWPLFEYGLSNYFHSHGCNSFTPILGPQTITDFCSTLIIARIGCHQNIANWGIVNTDCPEPGVRDHLISDVVYAIFFAGERFPSAKNRHLFVYRPYHESIYVRKIQRSKIDGRYL
ncbi:hypothetical protein F8388_002295 [Cannabis sativa]|uniref:N-acetyltransferase domain-containing protein n=1 Tax=Cannabis sativa TaxID=3483 RepID=A0A7J6E0J0_CANSA|nr:hypothetical protein F8388_002295 [Cannabis sativa]